MKPKAPKKADPKPRAKSGKQKESDQWINYGAKNMYPIYLVEFVDNTDWTKVHRGIITTYTIEPMKNLKRYDFNIKDID